VTALRANMRVFIIVFLPICYITIIALAKESH
jgi:hypothetical protein